MNANVGMNVGRRELVAWLGFLGSIAGSAYLAWLLFWHWPANAAALGSDPSVGAPVSTGLTVYVLVVAALQNWRRRSEPMEDERDRAIDGVAAKHAFIALALLNVVAGVGMHSESARLAAFGGEWLRLFLLWMVLASVAVFAGSQLYRYRRG
jgi:hypothetical protein